MGKGSSDDFGAKISEPAIRAFRAAGYKRYTDLAGASKTKLLAMHGVGPKGVRLLQEALAKVGKSLKD
ncbi:MAG TPA: hypothetical protein VMF90_26055 [Rhizobiaceae bacterium]|nr:hypothetical protein [Rhizobiaceae bacterium]